MIGQEDETPEVDIVDEVLVEWKPRCSSEKGKPTDTSAFST